MKNDKLKSLDAVVRAVRNLSELQEPTPQEILNYISAKHNLPKDQIKGQLASILKRLSGFGILKKAQGGQKTAPKKVTIVTGRRPCCKCKNCTGDCGYCTPDGGKRKKTDKRKQKMCRSSKPKSKKGKRKSSKKRGKRSRR